MPTAYSYATITGTAATITTVTLAAAPGVRRVVQSVEVSCVGAASGAITLSITDGATVEYLADLTLAVEVPQQPLAAPFEGGVGNALAISTSAGAASCVIKINVAYYDVIPGQGS